MPIPMYIYIYTCIWPWTQIILKCTKHNVELPSECITSQWSAYTSFVMHKIWTLQSCWARVCNAKGRKKYYLQPAEQTRLMAKKIAVAISEKYTTTSRPFSWETWPEKSTDLWHQIKHEVFCTTAPLRSLLMCIIKQLKSYYSEMYYFPLKWILPFSHETLPSFKINNNTLLHMCHVML